MQAPTSIQLTLEDDNSYEAGSTLRGRVKLIRSASLSLCSKQQPVMPMPAGGEPEENQGDAGIQSDGIVVISLEGFERTKVVQEDHNISYVYFGHRRSPTVYRDECRTVYEEKKYTLTRDNRTCAVDFSLGLPPDLPGSLMVTPKSSFNAVEQAEHSISYRFSAKWNPDKNCKAARGRSGPLSSSKVVQITKKSHTANHTVLRLAVSSMLEIPNFLCGFYLVSTTKTFSLDISDPGIKLLNLSPNQKLSLIVQQAEDLGLNRTDDGGTNMLMAKLTQKTQLFARKSSGQKAEAPLHIQSWNLAVNTKTGAVSIPRARGRIQSLNMSYQGKLIQFHHELLVYVVDSQSKSIVATTQPIPVVMSPGNSTSDRST